VGDLSAEPFEHQPIAPAWLPLYQVVQQLQDPLTLQHGANAEGLAIGQCKGVAHQSPGSWMETSCAVGNWARTVSSAA